MPDTSSPELRASMYCSMVCGSTQRQSESGISEVVLRSQIHSLPCLSLFRQSMVLVSTVPGRGSQETGTSVPSVVQGPGLSSCPCQ